MEFVPEAGGDEVPSWAALGAGECESVHGAGEAYVEEAALFFQVFQVFAVDGAGVGEKAVFEAADVDFSEFEAFGGVEREEVDGVVLEGVVFGTVEVGKVQKVSDGVLERVSIFGVGCGLVPETLYLVRGVGGQGFGARFFVEPHADLCAQSFSIQAGELGGEFAGEDIGRSQEALGTQFEVGVVFRGEMGFCGVCVLEEHGQGHVVQEAFVGHAAVAGGAFVFEAFEGAVEEASVVQGAVAISIDGDVVAFTEGVYAVAYLWRVAAGHGEGVQGGVGQAFETVAPGFCVEDLEVESVAVVSDEDVCVCKVPEGGEDVFEEGRILEVFGGDAVGVPGAGGDGPVGADEGVKAVYFFSVADFDGAEFENLGVFEVQVCGFYVEGGVVREVVRQVRAGEGLAEFEGDEGGADAGLICDATGVDEGSGKRRGFAVEGEDDGIFFEVEFASGFGFQDGQSGAGKGFPCDGGEGVAQDFVPAGQVDAPAVLIDGADAFGDFREAGEVEGVQDVVQVVFQGGEL